MTKKGSLTDDEIIFIKENSNLMSDEKLAKELKRSKITIVRARKKLGITKSSNARFKNKIEFSASGRDNFDDMNEIEQINFCRARLMASDAFLMIKESFNDRELRFFISEYTKYYRQFRKQSEVTATEEAQIMQLCKYAVLLESIGRERKECMDQLVEYDEEIRRENDMPAPDLVRIRQIESEKNLVRTTMGNGHRTLNELSKQYSQILKDLKGTRDQRVKELENRTSSYFDLVKFLNDITNQAVEAREMELSRLALQKQISDAGELHQFMDGTYDQILTSDETV